MSRTPTSPVGLNEWLDFFQDKSLPVRASTAARLNKALDHPSSNLLTLAPIIRTDPVLCLHVTRAAQALLSDKEGKIAGIDHAVQTLGFDQITQLLSQVKSFRLNPTSTVHTLFMRAVADSHHAATQAADWQERKNASNTEEVKLSALLYGFIHWCAWLYAPLHKEAYQRKVIEDGVDVALAEFDVFGCTLQELGYRLAQRWKLPELTVEALSHDTSPSSNLLNKLHLKAMGDPRLDGKDLREVNHFLQQPFFAVKLANWLALTATRGWNTPKARRLYEIIGDYLRLDQNATLARLHTTCAVSARQYHLPGVLSPASELLLIPSAQPTPGILGKSERQKLYETAPAVSSLRRAESPSSASTQPSDKPSAPTAASFLDQPLYDNIISSLRQTDANYRKADQVLRMLLQGVHEGLGMPRVSIMQINQHQLKPLINEGFDSQHPLTQYTNNLEIPSLFKRLCDKPTCIWYNYRTYNRLMPMLPSDFENCLPAHDWLMMSLFGPSGPLAIIYADQGQQAPPMDEFYFERFRYLGSSAVLALKQSPQE
ncbi:HDOD domain-containing protein [Nitrincola iocasae]|uniref:HDOD domain-containing protein n=1 Tax=Nitrincola iocasae TaxID=2614693 RepID=A0A5J6LGF3_9GAMM|nr:HDOD domain-containing protein [Nitrincola iocasae]QEW07635.1 HDOD domain-containing protein [Nitrincola iocasae]